MGNCFTHLDHVKYLGIHLDETLSCKKPCEELSQKLNRAFFIIFLFKHFYPGTNHAESINSDLQHGLDRRLRHTQH